MASVYHAFNLEETFIYKLATLFIGVIPHKR